MSVINNGILLASEAAAAGGYQISRSLRFNSVDTAYLSRTPGSAGNRDLWTLAFWLKRCKLGTAQDVFSVGTSGTDILYFDSSDRLCLDRPGATVLVTTQVFRDPSAWYHIVLRIDSTNGTNANKARLYVNGSEITTLSTDNRSGLTSSSFLTNTTVLHTFGVRSSNTSVNPCDIYLADIYMVDGSSLAPSSFGETDATTGVWVPKTPTGLTYGTNGFRLPLSDNSGTTSTTLGKDAAGSNNFTPNNFSVSSGAGNDSLVDSPTSYGTDTGAGGEVRGNYCTLNPLDNGGATLSNGNLDVTKTTSGYLSVRGTIGISSGKWYWEYTRSSGSGNNLVVGLSKADANIASYFDISATGYGYRASDGYKTNNNTASAYGNSYAAGDVVGVAFDADNGTLSFYKNGTVQNSGTAAFTSLTSGPYFPAVAIAGGDVGNLNFGARAFSYSAPSGFKALCTANLPTPAVVQPSSVFDVVLYTGTGSALTPTSTLGFNPDLAWIKGRSGATDHAWYDSVRGVEKRLESNNTDSEVTSDGGVTAFNSAGFSVGTLAQVNTSSATYAAWLWDAGSSSASTNNSGTITSTVKVNATAGFSIVTYTANGSNTATVGHGLGAKPALIIHKQRNNAESWRVYHSSRTSTGQFLTLNGTGAMGSSSDIFPAEPTSTVFTPGNEASMNSGSYNCLAYCFAPVAGLSAMGSYVGNGSSDGTFIYTGFRPRFILMKDVTVAHNWQIIDAARDPYNVAANRLFPNTSGAEVGSSVCFDFLSNGFKARDLYATSESGSTYVYLAMAESPFNYSRAR